MMRVGSGSSFDLNKIKNQLGSSMHQKLSHMISNEYYKQSSEMKVGCKNMSPIISMFSDTIASRIVTYTEDLDDLTSYKDAIRNVMRDMQEDPLCYYKQDPG
jgi:hypothetical protein